MAHSSFRVIALPTTVAQLVRETMRSPGYGHPASDDVAQGYGPCRHCLRAFAVGREHRILFTYDPFSGNETLPLPGPVFVHSDVCARYPEEAGFPDDLRAHALTLNAYARGRKLIEQAYVTNGAVEEMVERLLARTDVDYIHVRDTGAGCYDFRIERTALRPSQSALVTARNLPDVQRQDVGP
ncbi:MAG TPA: DUF1203 domain-containing protein [Candidatus Eremiobacteraceae bacterium]|nr:DUF1203 domain-containing protein [Candidatus Eremiobacteraceae bacterium]